jgi:subtilase family serine protease
MNKTLLSLIAGLIVLILAGNTSAMADLFVSEFSLNPSTPIQGNPVSVRVGVYNQGNERSGPFTVQWWPGENYRDVGCTWRVDGLAARGGRILTYTYSGYPSWYGSLVTKVVVDSSSEIAESNEANNIYKKTISVSKQNALPDLYIREFSLTPSTPTQGMPVSIRLNVYNKGTAASGPFTVEWWPGENYKEVGCTWKVDGLVASGGQILTCTYNGYPSWYGSLVTKAVADASGVVVESDEANNVNKMTISVNKP